MAEDAPALRAEGREYTVGELKSLVALRLARYQTGQFIYFSIEDVLQQGAFAPVYTRLAKEARSTGTVLDEKAEATLDAKVDDFARRLYYRQEILANISSASVSELRDYYEQRKDERFRTTEKFIMREILVPIVDAGPEAARAKADEIHARLEAGAGFYELMNEIVDDPLRNKARIVIPDQPGAPPPPIIETLRTLDNKSFSAPVLADDGYHIVYRQFHFPPSYVPFEAAVEVLADEFYLSRRDAVMRAYFRKLTEDTQLFRIDVANLVNTGELALDTDVLLQVGDREFTRGALIEAAGWRLSKEARYGYDSFREIAIDLGPVQRALLDEVRDRETSASDPRVAFYRQAMEETLLAENLLFSRAEPTELTVPDDEIAQHYTTNPGLYSNPAHTRYIRLSAPGDKFELRTLRPLFLDASTAEQFREVCDSLRSREDSVAVDSVDTRDVASLPRVEREAILEVGKRGGFASASDDSKIYVYWVEESSWPEEPAPSVRETIRAELEARKKLDYLFSRLAEESESVELEIYVPGYAP